MHRFGTATEQPSQLFINSACRQEKSSFCRSPIVSASVRSVAISADKARILVGTLSCEVVEFVAEAGCNFATRGDVGSTQWDRLVAGHFEGELWGLAVRPNTDQFCTARFGFASSLLSFSFPFSYRGCSSSIVCCTESSGLRSPRLAREAAAAEAAQTAVWWILSLDRTKTLTLRCEIFIKTRASSTTSA